MNDPQWRRLPRPPRPHCWQDCYPVITDPQARTLDLSSPANQAVRRIFNQLGQWDRVTFHQVTCQGHTHPQQLAVVQRIRDTLIETLTNNPEPSA